MSGNKLSPHIIYWNSDVLEFIGRTKPVIIKVVAPFGYNETMMKDAKSRSPDSRWLLRFYLNEQPLDKPKERATWLIEKIKRYFDYFDIFEDYNEIDPRDHSFDPPRPLNIDTIKRYNEFSAEFSRILAPYGKQTVTGCWSNGQPPDEAWEYLRDSVEWANYVSLHGYGWPTMSGCPQFTLRYRHIYHDLLGFDRPLILSEVGMTNAVFGGPEDLGWTSWSDVMEHQGEGRAAAEWAWLLDRINEDPFVISAHAYTTGRIPGDNWGTHDFTPRLYKLVGDYILGHPSPPPQEEEPMSNELIRALDVSEYGGGIKDTQWKTAYDAGYCMAIVQAWGGGPVAGGKNAYCAQQLAGARIAGMMTAIYFHLPSDTTTRTEFLIQAVKEAAGDEYQYIKFVAVDIEGDKLLHPTDPVARLVDAISHIKDKPIVIYTSRNAWDVVMGGAYNVGFEKYPLWDARYDELPGLEANWVPYGGWKERAAKQYQGTTVIAGRISADLNIISLKRLGISPEPPNGVQAALQKIGEAKTLLSKAEEDLLQVF